MAATITVAAIVGNGMSASASLFGAGVGTLVYQLFTKFRSPVFLGSSFAGLVYVVIAIIVKIAGVTRVAEAHPDVHIFVSTLDRCLNEKGYILSGLGDAGDRLFGAK